MGRSTPSHPLRDVARQAKNLPGTYRMTGPDGEVWTITANQVGPYSDERPDGVRVDLEMMMLALGKPVLDYETMRPVE